jgi:chaperonin GroES
MPEDFSIGPWRVQILTPPTHLTYIEPLIIHLFVFEKHMANGKNGKMNILPVGDRVLLKREAKEETKSPSGIIIPDTAQKEKSKMGTVVAVGAGRINDDGKLVAMSIKPGTRVIFNAGWDNEVDMGEKEEEYFLVKESDILAIIK